MLSHKKADRDTDRAIKAPRRLPLLDRMMGRHVCVCVCVFVCVRVHVSMTADKTKNEVGDEII